jgi:hypothetical protein
MREDLASLIEKYNKQFNLDAKKPNIGKTDVGNQGSHKKYQNKTILNPVAVPDPTQAEGNFSWMYLITPYYN